MNLCVLFRRALSPLVVAGAVLLAGTPLMAQSTGETSPAAPASDSDPGHATSPREVATGAFVSEHEVVLPGSPEEIYDAAAGDISGWWDHSYSDSPARFYIDPKPGGCFCEILDESGDGVRHATVTVADRGDLLRFEGPLGLTGYAVHMVHSFRFEAQGDSTRLSVSIHASGEAFRR